MPFVDMHDFGDMLVASGFATPVMDVETITLTYPGPRDLLDEVRALGASPLDDRWPALPSGRQARLLLDALAARRDAERTHSALLRGGLRARMETRAAGTWGQQGFPRFAARTPVTQEPVK